MKKTLLFGISAVLFTMSANAVEYKPYVSAKLNYSKMDNTAKFTNSFGPLSATQEYNVDDDVVGGSLAGGIKINFVRFELEGNLHQKAEKTVAGTNASIENNSIMFNTYIDIPTNTLFTPYIGFGSGIAIVRAKDPEINLSKTNANFAWQAGVGTAVEVTKNIAVDLGYRYVDNGSSTLSSRETNYMDVNSSQKWKLKSRSNEFYLGMRYTF